MKYYGTFQFLNFNKEFHKHIKNSPYFLINRRALAQTSGTSGLYLSVFYSCPHFPHIQ
jgi:hypothetical protein